MIINESLEKLNLFPYMEEIEEQAKLHPHKGERVVWDMLGMQKRIPWGILANLLQVYHDSQMAYLKNPEKPIDQSKFILRWSDVPDRYQVRQSRKIPMHSPL